MLANAEFWTLLIVIVHLMVITVLSGLVYRSAPDWRRYLGVVILFPWFGVTVFITNGGYVADMTAILSPLGIIMTLVVIGGLGVVTFWQPMKRLIEELPLSWLIGIQVYRVLGIVFLFGWLSGDLPTVLGPLTAFNDVLIGLTAFMMARAVSQGRLMRLAQWWNIYGLLDFAYAITLGVLAAPHALRLLTLTPDTAALGLLPLSLITLWAVPLSILLHVASLKKLAALNFMSVTQPVAVPPTR